jgi:hypothetical protein
MSERKPSLSRRLNRRAAFDPKSTPHAGWSAIEAANRIFGPHGWSREVLEMRCAATRDRGGTCSAAYVAKVRVTCQMEGEAIVREAHGCAEGRAESAFEAHDRGLKAAELDATLRVLATIGMAFGLGAFLPPKVKTATRGGPSAPGRQIDTRAGGDERALPETAVPALPPKRQAEPAASPMARPKPTRHRSPAHLQYVRRQPCLVCGRTPVDAHHVKYAQPKAMSRKVSDEFTVPLCRHHHDLLHREPDEAVWWQALDIDPLEAAAMLWAESASSDLAGAQ